MKEKFKSFLAVVGYSILAVAIQLITSLIGGFILGIIYSVKNHNITNLDVDGLTEFILQNNNYLLLASSIFTVLILMLIYKLKKRNIKNELLILKTRNSNLLIAILLGLSVWLVNSGIINLVEYSGVFQSAFDKFAETTSLITEGSFFSAFLVAGIIAPFAEEFLFRGVIYRTLNRYFSIITSILVQAILFGIFHGNMVQGVYATFLGIVFGYITYKSKSLWPAVIAHMSNNILALTLPYILPSSIDSLLGYSILSILGIILTTLGLLFINKTSIKYTTSLSID